MVSIVNSPTLSVHGVQIGYPSSTLLCKTTTGKSQASTIFGVSTHTRHIDLQGRRLVPLLDLEPASSLPPVRACPLHGVSGQLVFLSSARYRKSAGFCTFPTSKVQGSRKCRGQLRVHLEPRPDTLCPSTYGPGVPLIFRVACADLPPTCTDNARHLLVRGRALSLERGAMVDQVLCTMGPSLGRPLGGLLPSSIEHNVKGSLFVTSLDGALNDDVYSESLVCVEVCTICPENAWCLMRVSAVSRQSLV